VPQPACFERARSTSPSQRPAAKAKPAPEGAAIEKDLRAAVNSPPLHRRREPRKLPPVTASLTLRNDPTELRRLITFAEGFAGRHGLPLLERARLSIILEELFTNAVRHAYPIPGSPGRIEVVLDCSDERVTIIFSDDGEAFDPLKAALPDLEQSPAQRPVGGLGLRIVRALAEEARYRREAGRNHLLLTRRVLRHEGNDGSD
jgi:serine/threonine-protein kinase RsbW